MILCQQTSLWSCVRRFASNQIVSKQIIKQKRKSYRDYVKDINQPVVVFSEGSQHVCASTPFLIKGSRETNHKLRQKVLAW